MSADVDVLRGLDFTHIVVLICDLRSVEIDGSVHASRIGLYAHRRTHL